MTETLLKTQQAIGGDGWTPAKETWTYSSSDDPTYVITVPSDATTKYSPGMRVKLTDSGTQYFIITAVTSTTITLYGGTDYDLSTGTITEPYFSSFKAPFGFPLDVTKWQVLVEDTSSNSQSSPGGGTWYNPGSVSIDIPIGVWDVSYHASIRLDRASAAPINLFSTLSTANNSESDKDFSSYNLGNTTLLGDTIYLEKELSLSTKDTYYLNIKTDQASTTTIAIRGDQSTTIIRAVCAYL
jgi:hypothetical protein